MKKIMIAIFLSAVVLPIAHNVSAQLPPDRPWSKKEQKRLEMEALRQKEARELDKQYKNAKFKQAVNKAVEAERKRSSFRHRASEFKNWVSGWYHQKVDEYIKTPFQERVWKKIKKPQQFTPFEANWEEGEWVLPRQPIAYEPPVQKAPYVRKPTSWALPFVKNPQSGVKHDVQTKAISERLEQLQQMDDARKKKIAIADVLRAPRVPSSRFDLDRQLSEANQQLIDRSNGR